MDEITTNKSDDNAQLKQTYKELLAVAFNEYIGLSNTDVRQILEIAKRLKNRIEKAEALEETRGALYTRFNAAVKALNNRELPVHLEEAISMAVSFYGALDERTVVELEAIAEAMEDDQ